MQEFKQAITVDSTRRVSSKWLIPDGFHPATGTVLVLAHGAGNDMDHPFISHVHRALAEAGVLTVKFNFPYTETGRRAPDPAPVLEATWKAVIGAVRSDPAMMTSRMVLGGKSMGGRIASLLAAGGEPCDGLVFLGYPLHPAGKPDRRRTDHWPNLRCPLLFVQGDRDPLCNLEKLVSALPRLKGHVTLHVIEGGDHSFKLPKSAQRGEEDVRTEIVQAVGAWLHHQPLRTET